MLSREIGVPIAKYKEATKNQYHFLYVDKPNKSYKRNFNEQFNLILNFQFNLILHIWEYLIIYRKINLQPIL